MGMNNANVNHAHNYKVKCFKIVFFLIKNCPCVIINLYHNPCNNSTEGKPT